LNQKAQATTRHCVKRFISFEHVLRRPHKAATPLGRKIPPLNKRQWQRASHNYILHAQQTLAFVMLFTTYGSQAILKRQKKLK
jgi:hypothetical protein